MQSVFLGLSAQWGFQILFWNLAIKPGIGKLARLASCDLQDIGGRVY
jgi:hypothetical protein